MKIEAEPDHITIAFVSKDGEKTLRSSLKLDNMSDGKVEKYVGVMVRVFLKEVQRLHKSVKKSERRS